MFLSSCLGVAMSALIKKPETKHLYVSRIVNKNTQKSDQGKTNEDRILPLPLESVYMH